MRTYWVVGEDRERRMSRLAPPNVAKSPLKITELPRPLQKMSSAPSIRFSSNLDDYQQLESATETDKLLNGMLSLSYGYEREYKPRLPGRDRVNSEDASIDQFSRRMWFRGARGGSGNLKIHTSDDQPNRTADVDNDHNGQLDVNGWPRSNNGVSCQNDLENGLGNFYQETSSLMRFGSICEQRGPPPPYNSIGRRGRSGSGETSV